MGVLPDELVEGFLSSWGMILVSEIGDKTFFIAAVMAMKNPRLLVFSGAMLALAAMTVLSAAIGGAAPNLISKQYTDYAAAALFFFFGFRSLYDVFTSSGEGGSKAELEEVEREYGQGKVPVQGSASTAHGHANGSAVDVKGVQKASQQKEGPAGALRRILSPVFMEVCAVTFLAEWGDRSQIATIGLAASSNAAGVALGGIAGHAICTAAAVIGGRQLARYINERTVLVVGGLLFLAFGAHTLHEAWHAGQ
ncbi:hypothetical protein WJX74_001264 [Apatococcus lobatus]